MPEMTDDLIDAATAAAPSALLAQGAAGDACYLLVDSAFCPALRRIPGWADRSKRSLFADVRGDDLDDVAPYLLAIDPAHDAAFVDRVVQRTSGTPAVSAVYTPLSLDALAAHLASFVFVLVEPDNQKFVLRFADTRVLPQLVGALDERQRRLFLGPLREWRYVARDGRVACLSGGGEQMGSPGPLLLSAGQFSFLVDASEPDAVLAELRSRDGIPGGLLPSIAHRRLVSELQHATRRGIVRAMDRVTWASLMLESDAEMPWESEPLAAAVKRAASGQMSLADALRESLDAA